MWRVPKGWSAVVRMSSDWSCKMGAMDGMECLGRNGETWFDTTRAIFDPCLGDLACYEGTYDPATSTWDANHVGLAKNEDVASEWLSGGDPPLLRIYEPPF